MLPVIIAAADHPPLLGPDDLGANFEALAREAFGHGRGMKGAVPDVGDIARERRPGGFTIRPLVVAHLADA